jgi:hypothetical protein
MLEDPTNYYSTRERAERQAAKGATCTRARRIHQELAQAYARLVAQGEAHRVSPTRCR